MIRSIPYWLWIGALTGLVLLANGVPPLFFPVVTGEEPFLANLVSFSFELGGDDWREPGRWIDHWFFHQPAPYKYRLLGKLLIFPVMQLLVWTGLDTLDALHLAYVIWCGLLILLVLGLGGPLLARLAGEFRDPPPVAPRFDSLAAIGAGLLAFSPPLLLGMHFPVHGGVNDLLGYLLIILALHALLDGRRRALLVWLVLGVFCRETHLILLLPLLLYRGLPIRLRLGYALITLAVFLVYRLGWSGAYVPAAGAAHNLAMPWESIAFLLLVFGPWWFLAIAARFWLIPAAPLPTAGHAMLRGGFWPALLAVLVIVWSLARVREIRIEFILFPWVLGYALIYLIVQGAAWLERLSRWPAWLLLVLVGVISFRLYVELLPQDQRHHAQLAETLGHLYTGFGGGWRITLVTTIFASLWVLGMLVWDRMEHARSGAR